MFTTLRVRSATVAALGALAIGLPSTAAAADAAPVPSGDPGLAVEWLLKEMHQSDGSYSFPSWSGIDTGLTIDALLAIVAADPDNPAIPTLWDTIRAAAKDYVVLEWEGETYIEGAYAAKVLYAAQVMGADVHDVGGLDVAAVLKDKTDANGQVVNSSGTPENIFGQSLGMLAMARAGVVPAAMVSNVIAEQCPSGAFRMYDNGAPCDDSSDVIGTDATAMALQALLAARASGATVDDAVLQRAADRLVHTQEPDGGWMNDMFTPTVNANSTGLATQALSAVDPSLPAVASGGAWVAGVQALPTRDSGTQLAGDLGAIAYSSEVYADAQRDGMGFGRAQWQRTTPQGLLGLVPIGFHELLWTPGTTDPGTDPGEDPGTDPGEDPGTDPEPGNGDGDDGSEQAPGAVTPTPTPPSTQAPSPTTGSPVAVAGPAKGATTALAYTGAPIVWLATIAMLLLVIGGALVVRSRRRPATQATRR